jgi:hypothetical protein
MHSLLPAPRDKSVFPQGEYKAHGLINYKDTKP